MTHDDQKQEGIEARQRQKDQEALDRDMEMLAAHEFDEWVKECGRDDMIAEARYALAEREKDKRLAEAGYRILMAKKKRPGQAEPLPSHVTPKSLSDEARTSND